jgi:hypothetical protein
LRNASYEDVRADTSPPAAGLAQARPAEEKRTSTNLSSFFIVEEMSRGKLPKDAALEALRRVKANTVEKRPLNARGLPKFGSSVYALNAKGEYAGVTMYGSDDATYAVCN